MKPARARIWAEQVASNWPLLYLVKDKDGTPISHHVTQHEAKRACRPGDRVADLCTRRLSWAKRFSAERIASFVERGYSPRVAKKKVQAIRAYILAEHRGDHRRFFKWSHVNTMLDISLSSHHDWSRSPSGKPPESLRRAARIKKGLKT